jgi:hypothetical protein
MKTALTIVLLLDACSGSGFTGSGAKSSATESKAPATPPSTAAATTVPPVETVKQPTEVAGAFLVGCAPTQLSAPQLPQDGTDVYGCALLDEAKKHVAGVEHLTISFTFAGGEAETPPAAASPDPAVDVLIAIAKERYAAALGLVASADVAGKAFHSEDGAKVVSFDPDLAVSVEDGADTSGTVLFVTARTSQLPFQPSPDAFCQVEGGPEYLALIATLQHPLRELLGSGPVYDFNGNVVANSRNELLSDGASAAFPAPNGTAGQSYVWTGADKTGAAAAETCSDLTSTTGDGYYGTNGTGANGSHGSWISAGKTKCTIPGALYCYKKVPPSS